MFNTSRKVTFLISFALSFYVFSYLLSIKSKDFPVEQKNERFRILSLRRSIYNVSMARKLQKDVKICCMVMTHPLNHRNKSIAVKNTWAKKCDKLIFMSSKSHKKLNIVSLPIHGESRDELWNKTRLGFLYLHRRFLNKFDYFMKADDDKLVYS